MSFSNQSNGQYRYEDLNASFQPQLFVTNLPFGISQNAVAEVFQNIGFGNVEEVNIKPGKNGLYAILKFRQWNLQNTIQCRRILKSGKPINVHSTNWTAFEFKQKMFDKNKPTIQYKSSNMTRQTNEHSHSIIQYPIDPAIAPTLGLRPIGDCQIANHTITYPPPFHNPRFNPPIAPTISQYNQSNDVRKMDNRVQITNYSDRRNDDRRNDERNYQYNYNRNDNCNNDNSTISRPVSRKNQQSNADLNDEAIEQFLNLIISAEPDKLIVVKPVEVVEKQPQVVQLVKPETEAEIIQRIINRNEDKMYRDSYICRDKEIAEEEEEDRLEQAGEYEKLNIIRARKEEERIRYEPERIKEVERIIRELREIDINDQKRIIAANIKYIQEQEEEDRNNRENVRRIEEDRKEQIEQDYYRNRTQETEEPEPVQSNNSRKSCRLDIDTPNNIVDNIVDYYPNPLPIPILKRRIVKNKLSVSV
jgi:hypothetical protein